MKFQICVSGSARGEAVEKNAKIAYQVGQAIANAGHTLLTGATVGIPDHVARGCKAARGHSIGISPAATRLEHIKKYGLPTKSYDFILFTGLHYIGRDALLISSSDAIIVIGGRIGTLHEFTIALELDKPIGVLQGSGGTSQWFDELMSAAGIRDYESRNVIFDSDPVELVKRLTAILEREAREEHPSDELTQRL